MCPQATRTARGSPVLSGGCWRRPVPQDLGPWLQAVPSIDFSGAGVMAHEALEGQRATDEASGPPRAARPWRALLLAATPPTQDSSQAPGGPPSPRPQVVSAVRALRAARESVARLQAASAAWRSDAAAVAQGEVPEADVALVRGALGDAAGAGGAARGRAGW